MRKPISPTDQQPKSSPLSWRVWALLAVATLAYTWFYYRKMLSGPLVINDDMVQHYLWLFVEHFGLAWKDTFYAEASAAIQPRGFYWLLTVLGLVFDPVTISRAGPFLISLLTVGFGVAFLRRFTHLFIALAGSLLAIHLGFHSSVGFVARAFFMPLLLAFAYFLIGRERPWGVAAVAVCSALFYPPALLLNGGIFGLYKLGQLIIWGRGRRMQRKDEEADQTALPKNAQPVQQTSLTGRIRTGFSTITPLQHWYIYLLGFGVALLIVWLHAERVAEHPTLGGYLDRVSLISWPEFRSGGRVGIHHAVKGDVPSLFRYLLPANFHSPLGNRFPYFLLALTSVLCVWHRRAVGKFGWWLLAFAGAGILWYFVARDHFPLLFLPDRYLVYPLRLWTPMVLTLLLSALWQFHPKAWLAGLLSVGLLGYGYYRQPPEGLPTITQAGRELLFSAINDLPEATTLAAPPNLANMVPVFAHRNVFVSNESAHALYFKNYHHYVMPRFHDFVTAYTTTGDSLSNVVDFMDKWKIDHLLIDRKQLRTSWMPTFEPHQTYFKKRLAGTTPDQLTLLNLPDSVGVLVQDRLHLVSREDLASLPPTDPVGVNPH